MKVNAITLHRLNMPLIRPFTTSFGTQTIRDVLLVKVETDDCEGWGECVALADPLYSSEYIEGAIHVMRRYLLPMILNKNEVSVQRVEEILSPIIGHRMAKAAIESALLDAYLRHQRMSLADYLGATRESVVCGVSVGIASSIESLLEEVSEYVDQGYARIKLKIKPGWDYLPVEAVRNAFGGELLLQVDANAAYDASNSGLLEKLDEFNLSMIEQPFAEEDIYQHVLLAERVSTPICLDESIVSANSAADSIRRKACSIINIKPGRVGGYLSARRIHNVAEALNIPVWCGGMLETGIGRASNLALAGLPNFTLPSDTSASSRYFGQDLTEPFVLENGRLPIPKGFGIGVDIKREVVKMFQISQETIKP